MRVREGLCLDFDVQEVIKREYKERGFRYEYWSLEYWLVYTIANDVPSVRVFEGESELMEYLIDATRKGLRVELYHKQVVINDVQKVIKEQLSFLDDNIPGLQMNFLDTDGDKP